MTIALTRKPKPRLVFGSSACFRKLSLAVIFCLLYADCIFYKVDELSNGVFSGWLDCEGSLCGFMVLVLDESLEQTHISELQL